MFCHSAVLEINTTVATIVSQLLFKNIAMTKFVLLFITSLIFASTSSQAKPLKIASWNVAWLGSHEYNKRTAADYQALAHYAKQLDADVIALQEVESAQWAKKVLGDNYHYYFTTKDWVQRVGVAVRKDQGYQISATEYKALDQGLARRGMDVTLSKDGKKIRLLAVHLKSGCFDRALDPASVAKMPEATEKEQYAKTACAELSRQIKPLETWIDARAQEKTPAIILGDFNRRFIQDIKKDYAENQGLWQAIDDEGLENLWAPTLHAESKCWGGYYKDYIDHVIFNPLAKKHYVQNSFEQLVFKPKYTREISQKLSDHCPIAVEVSL